MAVNATDAVEWVPPWEGTAVEWLSWANALPVVAALNVRVTKLDADGGRALVDVVPLTPNPNGAVNGGLVVAMIDQLMAMVTIRSGPVGALPATGSIHTQFLSPALAPLVLEARVIGGGRRVTFVEAVVMDRDGRGCAVGQVTMVAGGSLRPEV